jgi:hypothetical protein
MAVSFSRVAQTNKPRIFAPANIIGAKWLGAGATSYAAADLTLAAAPTTALYDGHCAVATYGDTGAARLAVQISATDEISDIFFIANRSGAVAAAGMYLDSASTGWDNPEMPVYFELEGGDELIQLIDGASRYAHYLGILTDDPGVGTQRGIFTGASYFLLDILSDFSTIAYVWELCLGKSIILPTRTQYPDMTKKYGVTSKVFESQTGIITTYNVMRPRPELEHTFLITSDAQADLIEALILDMNGNNSQGKSKPLMYFDQGHQNYNGATFDDYTGHFGMYKPEITLIRNTPDGHVLSIAGPQQGPYYLRPR